MNGLLVGVEPHVTDEALQDSEGLQGNPSPGSGLLGSASAEPRADPALGLVLGAVQWDGLWLVVNWRWGSQRWEGLSVESDL